MAASPQVVARARTLARSPQFGRLVRYASVSVITTVGSLVLLYVFYRVLKIGSAAVSNVCTTAIMTIPSYYLNRTWAWRKGGRSHLWREVVPFWVIAFVSLVLSTGAVALAAHQAHHFVHTREGQTILVEAANFFTYAVLWVGKFTLFNTVLFKHDDGPSSDEVGAIEVSA